MTKINELKSLPKKELESKLKELKKEMIKYNAQIATGTTPKNPGQIKQTKKTIARILTIVGNQKESKLGDQKSPSVSKQNKPKKSKMTKNKKRENEEKING